MRFKYAAISLVLLLLAGCGKSVPAAKADFVGFWRAPVMELLITQDGSVKYQRLKGGATTTVSGPLQGFEGNNFSVGILFLTTTFVVSNPPHQEGEAWKMTVDGVELTRVAK